MHRTLALLWLSATAALAQTPGSPGDPLSSAPPGSAQPSLASASTIPVDPASEDPHPTLRVGLMVGLISVPRPINVELHAKLWDWFGLGVSYTYLPSFISDWLLKLYNINDVSI